MIIKHAPALASFTAGDGCTLSEVIHPQNDGTAPGVSLARARLGPGGATAPHRLGFLEIYYVLSGQGVMHVEDEARQISSEDCVYVPPQKEQWLENTSQEQDLLFLCMCHPAYDAEQDKPA